MLDYLFKRLTTKPPSGGPLFAAATAEARRPSWFRSGAVPDTLDGRFAILSTILALILVRLERDGNAGNPVSVALTERFIQVMESEHRELGLGDPALGRTVRKLVGSLARRTKLWRDTLVAASDWRAATRDSVYKGEPARNAVEHASAALQAFWLKLERIELGALVEGRFE